MLIRAKKRTLFAGIVVSMMVGVGLGIYAGNLDPPGLPAPTMKTLDEVEPRTPISNSDAPFVIGDPGSYYLTENLVAPGFGQDAITIAASGVTLDLRGFAIMASEVGQWAGGIVVSGTRDGIVVKNGTVRNCSQSGVSLVAPNSQAIEIRAIGNALRGVQVSDHGLVLNCTAEDNAVEDGIRVDSRCMIVGNYCHGNGYVLGDGAGISALGQDNHIEGNYVIGNDRGVDVDGIDNTIVKNVARENFGNSYTIVGGNDVGTLSNTPIGAGPWDNLDL